MKKLIGLLIACFLCALPLDAWGPLTHLTVNSLAYEQAQKEMGSQFCIPSTYRDFFIGGGPAPDIKQPGGAKFPRAFHNDIDTIDRMIELAKKDPRFGLLDVVEALGWAGHLYAEVTTAHMNDGYPNSNMMVVVPQATGINHQLNELTLDILVYAERREELRKLWVSLPLRLLETSMKAEKERDPSLLVMNASDLKETANQFLPVVVGIRTIAEYLVKERPELIEEMEAFHGRRHEVVGESVSEVVRLLKTHGAKDFTKTRMNSADETDKVRISLEGGFTEKMKGYVLNLGNRLLKTPSSNDIFTAIAFGSVKGLIETTATRDRFISLVKSLATGGIWGGDHAKIVLSRYVEGLLLRHDLTYPEILAYCQEGIPPDPENLKNQQAQFALLGLKEGGRAPVDSAKMREALAEVKRMESVRKSWPWFWPWRPSDLDLAKARERAGRMLAFFHIDRFPADSGVAIRARNFLAQNKGLRTKMQEYRITSYFNPLKKWDTYKQIGEQSEAAGKNQRFFADFLEITVALGGETVDANQLAQLLSQTAQRLEQTRNALAQVEQQRKNTPFWNFAKKGELDEERKRLQEALQNLQEYQAALQSVQEEVAGVAAGASANEAAAAVAPMDPVELKARYEKAYQTYVQLLGQKPASDPAVKKALSELQLLSRQRSLDAK
jgi:hypothetical protein